MKKIKSGKLSFVENVILEDKDKHYHSLLEGSHSYWEPDLNPEYIKEYQRDWREKKVCSWKSVKGLKEKFVNQNEVCHFIFNREKIRCIRDDGYSDNFSIMNQGSWEMTNYYNFKGKKGKNIFSFDAKSNPDWNLDFFIKKEKNITKKILGFNCYKTLIIELKQIEGELDIKFYEMFVTDEIDLPAHVVDFLNAFAIDECPLEIKTTGLKEMGIYNIKKAIKFEDCDTSPYFVIPEMYQNI